MRIKKTSQTTPVQAEVVNDYSTSQENAYSCDYVNNKLSGLGGKILWTNSSPTSSFTSQNITLTSTNYDMVEVVYALLNQNNYAYRKSTGRIPYEQGKKIQAEIIDYDGYIGLVVYKRLITMTSKTEFAITDSDKLWTTGGGTDNARCIPLYVIGYKTGLFPTQQSTRSVNTYSGDIEEKKNIVVDDGGEEPIDDGNKK
jgi:hypothetical protein